MMVGSAQHRLMSRLILRCHDIFRDLNHSPTGDDETTAHQNRQYIHRTTKSMLHLVGRWQAMLFECERKKVLFSVHGLLFAPLSMDGQNVKTENQFRANKSGNIAFCTDHFSKLRSIIAYATKFGRPFIPNWHWQNKSSFPWFCILNKQSLALFNCWCCVQ